MNKNIKFNIFISTIIMCTIISIFILNIFNKRVLPIFMNYAVSQIKNKSITLINDVVNKQLDNVSDLDDLIFVTKNSNNDIQMIDFNSVYVNKILNSTTTELLNNLKNIERGNFDVFSNSNTSKYNNGVIYEIPIGVVSNNLFLSNFGPKIPVKLNIVGDVFANINSEIKEYGINNALIKIYINISVTEKVIIPFMSENINISLDVPIAIKLIQGNIPIYYGNGFERNSNIFSTPIK